MPIVFPGRNDMAQQNEVLGLCLRARTIVEAMSNSGGLTVLFGVGKAYKRT